MTTARVLHRAARPSDHPLVRLAAAIALACVVMSLLVVASAIALIPDSLRLLGFNGTGNLVLGFTYAVAGWMIASRRPRNPIGWLFLVIAMSQAASAFSFVWSYIGLVVAPGQVPLADVASWMGVWLWAPGFMLVFGTMLVFPDGNLLSRRWRLVVWLLVLNLGVAMLPAMVASWPYRGLSLLYEPPPEAAADPAIAVFLAASAISGLLMLPIGVAALASVVLRYRRAPQLVRLQIRWFAAAGAVEVLVLVAATFLQPPYPLSIVIAVVILPLMPVAIGIAVLRYRLYEIDRIISRTIGWALVTGILVAVFAGAVIGLQAALAPVTENNTLAIAGSTLLAAALFAPVRRRVQRAVDSRFDRSRHDGERLLAMFSERLRDQVELATISDDLLATVETAVRPTAAGLRLRERHGGPA
jgi:hypothetical protein